MTIKAFQQFFTRWRVRVRVRVRELKRVRVLEWEWELERLEQRRIKDSWVRRLRLDEAKGIRRGSLKLAVTIASIVFIASIGVYFDILNEFSKPLATGIGVAVFLWLIVSYGDHGLRRIRVGNGWYGDNKMEVYELLQFIKKTSEDNGGDGSPPRRFFRDDELTIHAKADKERVVPSSIEAR